MGSFLLGGGGEDIFKRGFLYKIILYNTDNCAKLSNVSCYFIGTSEHLAHPEIMDLCNTLIYYEQQGALQCLAKQNVERLGLLVWSCSESIVCLVLPTEQQSLTLTLKIPLGSGRHCILLIYSVPTYDIETWSVNCIIHDF